MKNHVVLSVVPPESAINERLHGSFFHDCYAIAVPNSPRTALGHFLTALASTPSWVDLLMGFRNKVAAVVGMKDLGRLGEVDLSKPDSAYCPGDRVGVFTLISNTPNEVLLGVTEKCFDVVLSVYKLSTSQDGEDSIVQTTVVRVKNLMGRLYMLPVTPFHRLIAQTVLSRVA